MNRWKRLLTFLVLNVIVTALTMWVVLSLWSRANPLPGGTPETPPTQTTGIGADATPSGAATTAGTLEINTVVAPGDQQGERVLIRYLGEEELSLAGWQLEDEDGNRFVFPALRMFGGGAVTVHTRAGVNTVLELFWGLDRPVWAAGETVTLRDADGAVQATYIIP